MRSGVLTGNDPGGAAQVAAAHCPNERTLEFGPRSPQPDRPNYAPASCMAFTPQFFRQRLNIFSSEYYQILIATHLPTPEGWKAELA